MPAYSSSTRMDGIVYSLNSEYEKSPFELLCHSCKNCKLVSFRGHICLINDCYLDFLLRGNNFHCTKYSHECIVDEQEMEKFL